MPLCPNCQTPVERALMPCPRGDGFYAVEAKVFANYAGDNFIGRKLGGRFVISGVIGRGATGRVYKAHQMGIERDVVLKIYKLENLLDRQQGFEPTQSLVLRRDEAKERFIREAKVLGKLNHPNCVTVYDFGEDLQEHSLFIAMEHVVGVSLRNLIKRIKKSTSLGEYELPYSEEVAQDAPPPSGEVVLEIARQILMALTEAHKLGVVHRDLKPENILLTAPPEDPVPVVKVLDFGIAKLLGADAKDMRTTVGMLFGTPAYMSPEQCRGESHLAGYGTDVYAFGCILHELVTGELPFRATSSHKMIQMHLEDPVPEVIIPRLGMAMPSGLSALITRCLQKDPKDRFEDAKEVLAAFNVAVPHGDPLRSSPGVTNAFSPVSQRDAVELDEVTIPSVTKRQEDSLQGEFEAPSTVLMDSSALHLLNEVTYKGRTGRVEQGAKKMRLAAIVALLALMLCCALLFLVFYQTL